MLQTSLFLPKAAAELRPRMPILQGQTIIFHYFLHFSRTNGHCNTIPAILAIDDMAEDVVRRTFAAIQDVDHDPTKTLEEAEMALPSYLMGTQDRIDQRIDLMRTLAASLMDGRRAPGHAFALVNLLVKLFEGWTWQQVCDFGTQSIPYKDGLVAGEDMLPFNRLMLSLLEKATASAADAAHAASMLDTMQAVVKLWLSTSDTGVATQAGKLLHDLLEVDVPKQDSAGAPVGAQGLVWRRIFGDRDVYAVFFEMCSLESENGMSKNTKTIAQARLLELLPKLGAMHWTAVANSHHRDIEAKYDLAPEAGLLDFAALKMVDYKDDVLMHRCLIDFFSELLHRTASLDTHTMAPRDSLGLQYMITHGLHTRTTAIYLQLPGSNPDPVDTMFLYGPAANYLATYASTYPGHFLAGQMPKQVNDRLMFTLNLTPGKWAHSDSPKHDLHLAASLPRRALLPDGRWSSSPVSMLPSKATNTDALNTLATVFQGPEEKGLVYPPSADGHTDPNTTEEGAAARAIYYHYLSNNPGFWQDITSHADTVALKELALAAIRCISSVITANWSASTDLTLPTTIATPETGHLAILAPPALEYTLPYLLKSPPAFANLVGGRGDAESSTYKIAIAKFDALRALNSRLMVQVEQQPGQGYEDILATVGKKLAEGPMSREGEVGGRIGTLEL
ncbi:hypothetical protein B0A50_01237 [Salinomyces thailandicus]|uniref:Uncharacterized protein n=1 Tax=Salinomyces thailandicus TaxID=706561 RepID=A0A4U0UB88_9PEZI|nr:hypothetical protein B0A50_01237 [Salinomyces thailandica]